MSDFTSPQAAPFDSAAATPAGVEPTVMIDASSASDLFDKHASSALQQVITSRPELGGNSSFVTSFSTSLPTVRAEAIAKVTAAPGGSLAEADFAVIARDLVVRAIMDLQKVVSGSGGSGGASGGGGGAGAAAAQATAPAPDAAPGTGAGAGGSSHHIMDESVMQASVAATGEILRELAQLQADSGGRVLSGGRAALLLRAAEAQLKNCALMTEFRQRGSRMRISVVQACVFPELVSDQLRAAVWGSADVEVARSTAKAANEFCILNFVNKPPLPSVTTTASPTKEPVGTAQSTAVDPGASAMSEKATLGGEGGAAATPMDVVEAPTASSGESHSTHAEEAPAEGASAEKAPAEEAPAEKAPADGAPAGKAPAEGAPAEGAPAEKAPAEGAAAP